MDFLSELFPIPIEHTPPKKCVRVHLFMYQSAKELAIADKRASRYRAKVVAKYSKLMAGKGQMTTNEIAKLSGASCPTALEALQRLWFYGLVSKEITKNHAYWQWL